MSLQNERDKHFLNEALKEAKKAFALKEVPVGAVLVLNDKIIARAHNQVELLQDATAHAEMLALTMGAGFLQNFRLSEVTLYCTLEPCFMCTGALLLARISRLVYGAQDLRHGGCGTVCDLITYGKKVHTFGVTSGVLVDECGALLSQFFQNRRKENELEP